jgi:hypothetical protein
MNVYTGPQLLDVVVAKGRPLEVRMTGKRIGFKTPKDPRIRGSFSLSRWWR